jgi:hypothetical protein
VWEGLYPTTQRIQPASWDEPDLADWIAALELAVRKCAEPPMLVAHSLGCLLVASWAQHSSLPVTGAFLVAVPDPSTPGFKESTPSFTDVPVGPLRFPSLIVVSSSDPFDANGYGIAKARDWKSDLCSIGDCGHINGESNLSDWKFGQGLMASFILKCKSARSSI